MKRLLLLLLLSAAAALALPTETLAQAAAAKPRPLSSNDQRNYVLVAEMVQYHLNMGTRLKHKYKDTDPDLVSFGGKLSKEGTDLYTPGVNMAMTRGVPNDKIPQGMSKASAANVTKLSTIKDEKKWTIAFLELFTKDAKKHAADTGKLAKGQMDPELKEWVGKAATLFQSQSEALEAKLQERKAAK